MSLLMLYFFNVCHSAPFQTQSNAFLKAKKLWNTLLWWFLWFSHNNIRFRIFSAVLLSLRKPACVSSIMSSILSLLFLKPFAGSVSFEGLEVDLLTNQSPGRLWTNPSNPIPIFVPILLQIWIFLRHQLFDHWGGECPSCPPPWLRYCCCLYPLICIQTC